MHAVARYAPDCQDSLSVVSFLDRCRFSRHRPDPPHAGFPARFRASQHPARLPRCPTCRQRRPHRPPRGRARSPSSAPRLRLRRPPVALRLAPRRPRTAAVRLLLVTTPASSPQVSPPQPVFLLWRKPQAAALQLPCVRVCSRSTFSRCPTRPGSRTCAIVPTDHFRQLSAPVHTCLLKSAPSIIKRVGAPTAFWPDCVCTTSSSRSCRALPAMWSFPLEA